MHVPFDRIPVPMKSLFSKQCLLLYSFFFVSFFFRFELILKYVFSSWLDQGKLFYALKFATFNRKYKQKLILFSFSIKSLLIDFPIQMMLFISQFMWLIAWSASICIEFRFFFVWEFHLFYSLYEKFVLCVLNLSSLAITIFVYLKW